jgi:hypothetical protein
LLQKITLAYSFSGKRITFWRPTEPNKATLTLTDFKEEIVMVSFVRGENAGLIAVFTTEEITLFEYKVQTRQGTFTLEKFHQVKPLPTDRTRFFSMLQLKKSNRLFFGGERGEVVELKIDGVNHKDAEISIGGLLCRFGRVTSQITNSKRRKVDR